MIYFNQLNQQEFHERTINLVKELCLLFMGRLEEDYFFPLKTPTFQFWHWGSSNIFHPSHCFSSYHSKIENNPKGKPEHMLPPIQPLVCAHVRERSTDGFVKGCAVSTCKGNQCLWALLLEEQCFSLPGLLLPVPGKVLYWLLVPPYNF